MKTMAAAIYSLLLVLICSGLSIAADVDIKGGKDHPLLSRMPNFYIESYADKDFDSLFTLDKPVIFNFHGYPWLIHRLAYRRNNHRNMHVRGYKEKGSINTPLELAILNEIDRFSLVIDVIDRIPALHVAGAHVKGNMRDKQIECRNYAYEYGIDLPEADGWTWPY